MRLSLARALSFATVLGALAAAPTFLSAQAVASVCKDGTPSAASGRGACAGHGGVDAAATKTAKAKARADAKAAKAAARAQAKATKAAAKADKTGAAKADAKADKAAAASADAKADRKEAKAARSTTAEATTRTHAAHAAAASSGAKDDNDPTNALAQCNDGMYSHATNRRGACSRHGGVKSWMHS